MGGHLFTGLPPEINKAMTMPRWFDRETQILELKAQIARLNRIGIALSVKTELSKLLEVILAEVRGFTRADAGSLYIKRDNLLYFEVAQNDALERGPGGQPMSFKPFPLNLDKKSIAGYVAVTGEVLNIEDVYRLSSDLEFNFNRDFDQRNHYRSKSMLVLPMRDHENDIIGVLQLINALNQDGRITSFSPELVELVSSLCSQAAVAIRNALLINNIKNLFDSLVRYSASAINARSPHTAGHSKRVTVYVRRMVDQINATDTGCWAGVQFSPGEMEEIIYAAWLHDVGKIGVREKVLEKANKLSDNCMMAIRHRLDYIRLSEINALYQEVLNSGLTASPAQTKDMLEKRVTDINNTFSRYLDLVTRVNMPGFFSEEDKAALDALGQMDYLDERGHKMPYLYPHECECLSVSKGNLTKEEYREIQSHVVYTKKILSNIPFTRHLKNVPLYAAGHHEMLNGTGYPEGLRGDQIPLQSRLLAVADIFDALTAKDRPYKKIIPVDVAVRILEDEVTCNRLDGNVVKLFVDNELYHPMPGDEGGLLDGYFPEIS
ncbi:MAG: GAF domain-containing protein [Deltaproteobacteria bacterium]|nr:GAF domain-containing protein [Deltaproteobacteria bacterium]